MIALIHQFAGSIESKIYLGNWNGSFPPAKFPKEQHAMPDIPHKSIKISIKHLLHHRFNILDHQKIVNQNILLVFPQCVDKFADYNQAL